MQHFTRLAAVGLCVSGMATLAAEELTLTTGPVDLPEGSLQFEGDCLLPKGTVLSVTNVTGDATDGLNPAGYELSAGAVSGVLGTTVGTDSDYGKPIGLFTYGAKSGWPLINPFIIGDRYWDAVNQADDEIERNNWIEILTPAFNAGAVKTFNAVALQGNFEVDQAVAHGDFYAVNAPVIGWEGMRRRNLIFHTADDSVLGESPEVLELDEVDPEGDAAVGRGENWQSGFFRFGVLEVRVDIELGGSDGCTIANVYEQVPFLLEYWSNRWTLRTLSDLVHSPYGLHMPDLFTFTDAQSSGYIPVSASADG